MHVLEHPTCVDADAALKRARRLRALVGVAADALKIHEIFASIQGEGSRAGMPCTFVRTTACHLRCNYCDTRHAFMAGQTWSIDQVMARVSKLGPRLVLLTGGEPLLQAASLTLMQKLADERYTVLLETSGSLDIAKVDARVIRIVDMKTPSSGEMQSNHYENLKDLRAHDEVKFVIGGREDYIWAKSLVAEHRLNERCVVLMGPIFNTVALSDLAAWILRDRLDVRLQIQLHKIIWDPKARGV